MRKSILGFLVMVLVLSMVVTFSLLSCKEEAAPVEEEVEEAAPVEEEVEEAAPVEEEVEEEQILIGFSICGMMYDFFVEEMAGVEEAAEEAGVELMTASCEFDSTKQVTDLENFLTAGCDAIIVEANDPTSTLSIIKEIRSKGVPVITVDCDIEDHDLRDAFVGSNNFDLGKTCAELLVEKLEGKGSVVELWSPTPTTLAERSKGFESVLAEYQDITIVAKEVTVAGKPTEATAKVESILTGHEVIDGIFYSYDQQGTAVCEAIAPDPRCGEICIVGVDINDAIKDAIKKGWVYATVVQNPREMGRTAVELALKVLKGEEVPKETWIPGTVVTKDTLD